MRCTVQYYQRFGLFDVLRHAGFAERQFGVTSCLRIYCRVVSAAMQRNALYNTIGGEERGSVLAMM